MKSMNQSNVLSTLCVIFLLTFLFFSVGIPKGIFIQFDRQSMILIQQLVPLSWDTPLSFLSLLGSFEVTSLILCGMLFFRKKTEGLIIFGFYGLGLIIELIEKNLLHHAGPPSEFFRYGLNFHFPTSTYQTGNSFPSGHVLRTSFLVTLFLLFVLESKHVTHHVKSIATLFFSIIFILMFISRISLGEHWLSDVSAGATLGAGLALVSMRICH